MTASRFQPSLASRLRLWVSYQRYALGFAALSASLIWLSVAHLPWWTWPVTALAVVKMLSFAAFILSRHSRKVRATAIAAVRIEQGRFRPESVESYCGDPCFRLVAAEALSRAGYPRSERRSLIREYARRESERASATIIFDRQNGQVIT
ncbi:MAG: hypothetical protein KJO07_01075, partial [Deltaproteobacteria bacterium]|nr:hypothetical protein [Deltaproteobacteria bacterium]